MSVSRGHRDLVREGVDAAKRGDRTTARNILQQATQLHSNDATAWIWFASVATNPSEKVAALRKFLQIRPGHAQGQEVYKSALLEWGLAAARSGDKPQARIVLSELCELDKANDAAKFWLASVAPNQQEAVRLLKQVIELNPRNVKARTLLQKFEPAFQLPPLETVAPAPVAQQTKAPQPVASRPAPQKIEMPKPVEVKPKPAAPSGPAVLVLDEDPKTHKEVSASLEKAGYRVIFSSDSNQAVHKAEEDKPELALLDSAAGGDGFNACKKIKETSKNTVVLMMLAKDNFFEKMKGRMAGATDYLIKPLDSKGLLEMVQRYCPK